MKKKLFSLTMAFLLFVMTLAPAFVDVQQAAAEETWIDIRTANELDAIRNDLTKNYRLVNDIDLSSYTNWEPIGTYAVSQFTGKFDGQGHTIANVRINKPNTNHVGLFSFTEGAFIANVHLTNVNVSGYEDVGGLVGQLTNSIVSGVSVSGTVTGNEAVGGLTGYSDSSSINDSYTTGLVAGGASPASDFGGIVGYASFRGGTANEFRNVYSSAAVYASPNSGGLIGSAVGFPRIYNAYWDTESSGLATSAGGGTGRTKTEMMRQSMFADWDFTNQWGIVEGVTSPLSRGQYENIALGALTVKNTIDGTAIPFDRPFSSDYGVYIGHVVSQIDHLDIEGTAIHGTSSVSINGSGSSETVALAPGENVITIRVTAINGLSADYKLTVTRDAGTAQYPHRITTAAQLADIGNAAGYDLSHAYRLESDLDLSGYAAGNGWLPVGSNASPFTGIFDGNHHTIANLTVNRPGTDDVGLFGRTDGARVTDLAVTNANISGHDNVGGLIGTSDVTILRNAAVHGAVHGNDKVAGLIGIQNVSGSGTLDYSYSTAYVDARTGSTTGGLVADSSGVLVTRSFWDTESSQQPLSDGGTGKTTNELKTKATYTAEGWLFGSGQSWDMIEGTGYPMPLSSFANVTLSDLALSTPGATHTLGSFDAHLGVYTATVNTPVPTAAITATPSAAGASVTFNGLASGSLDLHLGSNPIDVLVTSPDGVSQGLYHLTLTVPTPRIQSIHAPADGTYGIGQQLDFTVTFDHSVDITGMPMLPIDLNGADTAAVYVGQPTPTQLAFAYTVQAGDLDSDGIALGSAITAAAPSAITAIGETVPLTLAGIPSLSGVLIDGVAPTIGLTPSTTAPTNGTLTVSVTADGTGSVLSALKWAAGMHAGSYFSSGGTDVASSVFQVPDNGTYTVFARDEAGNTAVSTITIGNIMTQLPTIVLDYTPKTSWTTAVNITVSAAVYEEGKGNALSSLRWAPGDLNVGHFADPTFGTAVPVS